MKMTKRVHKSQSKIWENIIGNEIRCGYQLNFIDITVTDMPDLIKNDFWNFKTLLSIVSFIILRSNLTLPLFMGQNHNSVINQSLKNILLLFYHFNGFPLSGTICLQCLYFCIFFVRLHLLLCTYLHTVII